jgi:hypothetical protein
MKKPRAYFTFFTLCFSLLLLVGCGVEEDKRHTEEKEETGETGETEETEEAVKATQGETLVCELSPSVNTIADHITYETGSVCSSACEGCMYSDDSEQSACSTLCETDSDCDIGAKCVGCFTLFVCAKACESEGDCSFSEDCESGICLPKD